MITFSFLLMSKLIFLGLLKYIIFCLPDLIYWRCFLLCFFTGFIEFFIHFFFFQKFILILNFSPIPDFFMQVLKYLPWFIYFIILFEVIGILKIRLLNLGIYGFILWWIMKFLIILFNYLIFHIFNVFPFQFCIC